jgi:hypothetical protein
MSNSVTTFTTGSRREFALNSEFLNEAGKKKMSVSANKFTHSLTQPHCLKETLKAADLRLFHKFKI